MKELSLLMFVVACGYVLGRFLNRFAAGSVRQRNFFIPSQADSNLLWGFAFYFGFAALMFHSHHKIWPLAAIAAILFFSGILQSTAQKSYHAGFAFYR